MRPVDIVNKSDKRSKRLAQIQSMSARLYKVEGNKILYTVNSATGNNQYLITIQLLDLTGNVLKSLRSALNGNIKISCTCPAFLYFGYKYITYKGGYGINKETRPPDKNNPNKEGAACKHILVALEQMKKDYNSIYNLFKLQVKSSNIKPTDISDNKDSDEPTEYDIKIITDFKLACNKLYKDYTDYLNSGVTKDAQFVDSKYYDKVDPSTLLTNLSKPVLNSLNQKFIGKLKSLDSILDAINQKKNGFNIMLDSDVRSLIKKLNSVISTKTEALINNIILSLMYS